MEYLCIVCIVINQIVCGLVIDAFGDTVVLCIVAILNGVGGCSYLDKLVFGIVAIGGIAFGY